jgi:poly-beta-1,6-N-acetyl-D-glucosamine synthase
MTKSKRKYAVIIPSKNEEELIANALESIVNQTIPPEICVVVDDGSTDNTPEIVREFARNYSFIRYARLNTDGFYRVGKRVVGIFELGRKYIEDTLTDIDWIVKLDCDIAFRPFFMEAIFSKLEDDKWGIVSGTPYYFNDGVRFFDYSPDFHSHGQFKIYNKECLKEIGGLDSSLGWDCSDNIRAIDKGWKTAAFRDIYYHMQRPVGTKISALIGRKNSGRGAYLLGYSFIYMLIKVFHDSMKHPKIIGSLKFLFGYFSELIQFKKRILNRQQRILLRKLFWISFFERFTGGKFVVFQILKDKFGSKWQSKDSLIYYWISAQLLKLSRNVK